jgi:hypothetical protein
MQRRNLKTGTVIRFGLVVHGSAPSWFGVETPEGISAELRVGLALPRCSEEPEHLVSGVATINVVSKPPMLYA